MHLSRALLLGFVSLAVFAAQVAHQSSEPSFAKFADVTASTGIHFNYLASHTSKKYLLETMGAGVALFDYDNDGLLDIFFVNGAPLADPTMSRGGAVW